MKIKIYDLINSKEILERLYTNSNLPTKTAYNIYIMLSKLNPSFDFFEKKRNEAFDEYGQEDGDNKFIPQEHIEVFYKKMQEIGELECGEDFEKVDISLDIDLGVSPAEIALLTPFINFVE